MINYPKYSEKDDLRVKIYKSEHQKIKTLHKGCMAIRAIAREYEVDKRTIQFILFPERLAKAKENYNWKHYYTKEKRREYQKKHRRRKMLLQGKQVKAWRKETRTDRK